MKKVISVRFKENGKSYYFDPGDAVIHAGEYVIVETARGVECGEVVQGVLELADAAVPKALNVGLYDSVRKKVVSFLSWYYEKMKTSISARKLFTLI